MRDADSSQTRFKKESKMTIGFVTCPIDNDGNPCEYYTGWKASCFVFLFWVVFVGKVVPDVEPPK